MIEQEIEIGMRGGSADAVVFRPEGEGSWPGVVHLTDIGGIRPAHRGLARRLAAEGYVVLMPNIFFRTSRPPVFEVAARPGEDVFMKRFGELTAPLTPEVIAGDASIYMDNLAAQPSVIPGKLGVVGHCYTGALAMRFAAARPERIAAAASFHGGRLLTDTPDSPHLLLPSIRAELYFAHAVRDRSMPEEAIEKFNRALAAWGGRYESEVYEGAYHGWTASDSPSFNQPAAERAFAKLSALFARVLR